MAAGGLQRSFVMNLFSSGNLSVRMMDRSAEDSQLLLSWLTDPRVTANSWNEDVPWDELKVRRHFFPSADDKVTRCIIEYNSRPVGYIQYAPVEEDSYRFTAQIPYERFSGGYGLDLFIGKPELWGHGIGPTAVRGMKDYLFAALGATVVCADPAETNIRSVRCCLKAGFTPFGRIADYDDPAITGIFMIAEPSSQQPS